MGFEDFVLEMMLWMCGRMGLGDLQLEVAARLRERSTSHDTVAREMESGLSDHASWRMETDEPIGTMRMELGDPTDLERLLKTLPSHQLAVNMEPGQIIYLPQGEGEMVTYFRPIERIIENRHDRMIQQLESRLRRDGRTADASLLSKIQENPEAMEMMRQETTVAYAHSQGIEVAAFGEQDRPFFDFLGRMIDGQVFRKFAEWVFEHKEEILELAKMIAAIIGIFA
jgi:hypothetical protein